MKPLAPEVVAAISICSKSVRVRGNIAGATVDLLVNGNKVSSHVTTFPDDFYPLGAAVLANQKVTARQTITGQTSPESLPVTVQNVPAQPSALTIKTVLRSCGRIVRVTGAVPGAKIDAFIGAQQVGAGTEAGGWADVIYDPPLTPGQTLTLKQITCNNLTTSQTTPAAVAAVSPLPAPVIEGPLIECQTRITIGGVIDGAYVELYRNNSPTPEDTFTFSLSKEVRWIKPLVKNDVIKVRQGLNCKKPAPPLESSSPYATAAVQPVSALNAPKFLAIPCPGTTYITLTHLVPGARVILTQNGTELGETDAPDTTFTFTTPPLTSGATLEAHMEMCNGKGPTASITVSTATITPLALNVSPLYACAADVAIEFNGNSMGNYLVYITNKNGQQISGYHNVIGISAFIPVFPSLVAGDAITFHVQGCGGAWDSNGPDPVHTGPPPPTIQQPVQAGFNALHVVAMAGFQLNAYVNNLWRGSAISFGIFKGTEIPLSVTLQVGESVTCTQIVCGMVSKPTPASTVTKQTPRQPILQQPPNNATGVTLQPTFHWQDPGAGTLASADSFQLLVTSGNSTIINTPLTVTSYLSPVTLAHSTNYKWDVTSINTGGHESAAAPFIFTTQAPPPPPAAVLRLRPPIRTSPAGPFPRGSYFEVTIQIVNKGNAASGAYSIQFEERSSDDLTLLVPPDPAPMPALAAGATASASIQAIIDINYNNAVRIDAFLIVNGQQVDQAFLVG
jgi:hypothetical protein